MPFLPFFRHAASFALAAAGVWGAYVHGVHHERYRAEAQIAALRQEAHAAALAAEEAHTQALEASQARIRELQAKAQAQSLAIANAEAALAKRQKTIKKEIPRAIQQDSSGSPSPCGLGAHSLQLYRRALGYPDQNHPQD